MKRKVLMMVLVLVAAMFVSVPGVQAIPSDNIYVGQTFYMDGGGANSGGPFTFHPTGGSDFTTFCAIETEYFYPGRLYTITALETNFSAAAAALYYHFRVGDLPNLGDANAIQAALWYLEGTPDPNVNGLNNLYVGQALSYDWQGTGPVVHIDYIGGYPSTYSPGQDEYGIVPEPTTMLLLGLGLVGIAGIRRKFKG